MLPFDLLKARLEAPLRAVRTRIDDVTYKLKQVEAELRRAWADQQREMDAAAEKLGLPSKKSPVIDVGTGGPSLLLRATRVGVAATAAVVGVAALLSFSVFAVHVLLLLLLLTRGLGLRLDVSPIVNPRAG